MKKSKAIWLLIILLATGCASSQGFDRAAMEESLHVNHSPIPQSQPPENQDVRLSPPFRLGIFFAVHNFPNRQSIRNVEWLTTDREQLLHQLAPLRDEHILGDTFVLMDATLRGDDARGIRQAGARYGADLVLIMDGAASIDRYNNRYAWLYPTLIGAYLAPGTESAALVMVTGSLWETRSDRYAPNQTAEGLAKTVGSAVLTEDSNVMKQAKKTAIEVLAKRLTDQLRQMKEGLARPKSDSR
jgi:hypothetical protein